jgi:hydrogenase maturation protease
MSREDATILVLGVGNVLLRDDGIGVHAVRALGRLVDRGEVVLPPGTALVDGGTLGRDLLPILAGARAVVLIDAVDLDRAPGRVAVIRGDALRQARSARSPLRAGGIADLLAAAELAGVDPGAITLVGVQPREVAVGLEPTEAVQAQVPAIVEATLGELQKIASASVGRGREMAGVTP